MTRGGLPAIAVVTGVVLGGCDRIFDEGFRQRDANLADDDAKTDAIDAAPGECSIVERFDAPLDPLKWERIVNPGTDVLHDEASDTLQFTVDAATPGGDSSFVRLRSRQVTHLVNRSIEIRLVDVPGYRAGSGIRLTSPGSLPADFYEITLQNDNVISMRAASVDNDAEPVERTVIHDPAVHRWFRIRHSASASSMFFETFDGSTWTTMLMSSVETAVDNLQVEIIAFSLGSSVDPRIARWDDVLVREGRCLPPQGFPP